MKLLAIVIICLVASVPFFTPEAHALTKDQAASQYAEREQALQQARLNKNLQSTLYSSNILVIDLDATCLKFAKLKLKSGCPSYEVLAKLDTTNKYAGKFVDQPYYHRDKVVNKFWYKLDKDEFIICVDCPKLAAQQARFDITITGQKMIYKLDIDKKMVNNTRYEYQNRYVDNCSSVLMSYSSELLQDTINYLKSGCKETKFPDQVKIVKPYSKLTYDGNWYKHMKYLEEAKKLKTTNCLKSKDC